MTPNQSFQPTPSGAAEFGRWGSIARITGVNLRRPSWTGAIHVGLILVAFGASFSADAQQPGRSYRLGFVTPYSIPPSVVEEEQNITGYRVFEQTLKDRGHVPGQNLSILYRTSQGRNELFPSSLSDLS